MENLVLKSKIRETGKSASKTLKKNGAVLAEVYGNSKENMHVYLPLNEFVKVYRKAGSSTVVTLEIEGAPSKSVLIHEVEKHYLHSQPIHIDFYEVSLTEKLTAEVELNFVGESMAVKALGGNLVTVMNSIEVEALAKDLPHDFTIDISALNTFDDQITVADIALPKGVTCKLNAEEVIALVQAPRDVASDLADTSMDISQVEGVAEKEKPAEESSDKK